MRHDARLFESLSATNEAILRTTSRENLFQRVCDVRVAFALSGSFESAAVEKKRAFSHCSRMTR
jgi:hypothetical protein